MFMKISPKMRGPTGIARSPNGTVQVSDRLGALLQLCGTAAGAANVSYISFCDILGVRQGFVGDYAVGNSDISLGADVGGVSLLTNATVRLNINNTGNATLNAPTSGTPLTLNSIGNTAAIAITADSTGAAIGVSVAATGAHGVYGLVMTDGNTGNRQWAITDGFSGTGYFTIRDVTAAADRLYIDTVGAVSIAAPDSAATALTVTGISGTKTLQVTSSGAAPAISTTSVASTVTTAGILSTVSTAAGFAFSASNGTNAGAFIGFGSSNRTRFGTQAAFGTELTANSIAGVSLDTNAIVFVVQPTPTAVNATATLTIAQMLTLIITSTSAAATTMTLPTGTLTDAGVLLGTGANNISFDWSIINTGPSTVTLAAGTAHTIVGTATTATLTASRWRTRKTAANTYVTYRLSV